MLVVADAGPLIDELRGRRVAQRLHLRVEGTLGLLVRGKRAGEVKKVAPLLRMMIEAGFWISDEVVSGCWMPPVNHQPDMADSDRSVRRCSLRM